MKIFKKSKNVMSITAATPLYGPAPDIEETNSFELLRESSTELIVFIGLILIGIFVFLKFKKKKNRNIQEKNNSINKGEKNDTKKV